MDNPLICHLLIGPPGSGKSTLAAEFAKLGDYRIVSTDQIRGTLYGDAGIQGEWSAIETEVLCQIRLSCTFGGKAMISDSFLENVFLRPLSRKDSRNDNFRLSP